MSNVALQDMYANNLRQNLGYPLRCPNPSGREGLRIGDVGHVDDSGVFHVLCNIRSQSRSDPKFKAIQLNEDLIYTDATAVLQHPFFTGVKQDISQESGIYKFTATAAKGAILILPSGAKLCDLKDQQKLDEFRNLAVQHAHRWCLSAGHDSLYLITGLYQTASWTLGSFYGRRDVDGEKVLVQKSVEEDDLAAYKWEFEFPNLVPQSCRKATKFENQTVLIKGFKMKVRPKRGVTVEGLAPGSRNFFSLLVEYLMCLAWLVEYLKRLASQFGIFIPPITSIQSYPEPSRQPHYLDVVNDYLLEENSEADVVITHDDVWMKMLEQSKSMVIQESRLLERVKEEYVFCSGKNAIWLQRRPDASNGVLVPRAKISESRVVITHICAENVTVGLGYVPVGFFVRVEIDGGISRRTDNKPALVDDHNIQWNDRIYLPSALSTKIRLVLCASFEFSPVLGSGESLGTLEICVSDLLERTSPFTITESMPHSLSLLVSARRWYGNHWMYNHVDDRDRKERLTLPDVTNLTDEGHRVLLGYYRNHDETDLESSVTLFTQALEKCPQDDPRRVVALSNLAKAQFLSDQFRRAHHNFHDSTSMFKEALRLRAGDHRDRPMTLLYLSQALLYYRASGLQVPQSTLRKYINELEVICPRGTHARLAADLVLQTHELDGLQISDDLRKLNELISKWVRTADDVPEAYFDKSVRFDNIGLALQRRFQLCHDTTDLERAIEWFEKAVQTAPDGHVQKSTYANHLSDARLYQWAKVTLTSSLANEALDVAVKEFNDVPKSHVYWVICDILEGSNRVLEAIECFRKMEDELLEMHTPNERTWEVDFRRRCVKKLEEKGDMLMESRGLDTAIQCYSISLSLSPTNMSVIIVKCCAARAGLLEEQRLINANKKFHVYRVLCDGLEGSDRIPEAIACFRKMQDELLEVSVPHDQAEWAVDFRRRCVDKVDKQGNGAMDSKDHESAIGYYSYALSLDPTDVNIIVKSCKARVGSLEDELIDATKAIDRDPSSHKGHKKKHSVLHSMGRYREAFGAFETMLSTMEKSADPQVRVLRSQYLDTTPLIRMVIDDTIHDIPRVLIDTVTGRLYDKMQQAAAFEELLIFDELRSAMTTHDRLNHARLKQEVEKFYQYVMFSHRWQPLEPSFQMVEHMSIYGLPESPTTEKLLNFCSVVKSRRFRWAWSDTCCVTQADKGIQQESVVAMFRWFRRAALTIVHLLGVFSESQQEGALWKCIWNTRAWTLQEYIASRIVQFYTEDWKPYLDLDMFNHKESPIILAEMEQATSLATRALTALEPGLDSVREKLYLASRRETARKEDHAYSLFGIFNIHLSVIYGEGNRAIGRLLEHILVGSDNVTILAWSGISGDSHSYLPVDLTVYDQIEPPHVPQPMDTAEMDRMTKALQSSLPDPLLPVKLYERLCDLPTLSITAGRLRLPGFVFSLTSLTAITAKPGSDSIVHVYHATTPILGDVRIETNDNLVEMHGLMLIHPWISPLLDRDFFGGAPQFDLAMRALRLIVRLKQPFGALLLASQGRVLYKRVATDSFIRVQIRAETVLEELMNSARTVDVQ